MGAYVTTCKSCPGLPKDLGSVIVPSWRQTIFEEFRESVVVRGHTFMTSSRWGKGWSGKTWSKFRRKWMVTGFGGEGRGRRCTEIGCPQL